MHERWDGAVSKRGEFFVQILLLLSSVSVFRDLKCKMNLFKEDKSKRVFKLLPAT